MYALFSDSFGYKQYRDYSIFRGKYDKKIPQNHTIRIILLAEASDKKTFHDSSYFSSSDNISALK